MKYAICKEHGFSQFVPYKGRLVCSKCLDKIKKDEKQKQCSDKVFTGR